MKVRQLFLILLLQVCIFANAQIPADVMNVMNKCSEKMNNPAGYELDFKLHAGMLVFSMNGTVKIYSKGEKSYHVMTMKVLGKELKEESGFDGVQEWKYKQSIKSSEPDSLIITKVSKKGKGDYDIDLDIHKDYKTAKMKVKGDYYEITFSNPKDKESPKQTLMKINKNNYYFHEMSVKEKGLTVRMTATKIKFGVNDDMFKLDLKKYPKAKVIRK